MANPEHLRILNQGPRVWNDWRSKNDGIFPDLSEAKLEGAKLCKEYIFPDVLNPGMAFGYTEGINLISTKLSGADLRGADLREANLTSADLSYADLSNADLSSSYNCRTDYCEANLASARFTGASLNNANLSAANLEDADIENAGLWNTELKGANLMKAWLGWATISNAQLTAVNLRDAELNFTTFEKVELNGADIHGANFFETAFINCDLSKVKNIEACKHKGPSYVDHTTLSKSRGLPEIFLRGCGLSNWEIDISKLYSNNLTPAEVTDIVYRISESHSRAPIQFYSCFISYSHADKHFAQILYDSLQNRGIRCWFDISKLYSNNLTPAEVTDIVYRISESHSRAPIQFYSCFISYSHADKHFAQILY